MVRARISGHLDWGHLPLICSLGPQLPCKGGLAQLFEPAIVMVSNIAQRLSQPASDLFQGISLEEMQLDGSELGRGEKLPEPGGRFPSPDSLQRPLAEEYLVATVGNVQDSIVKLPAGVEVPRVEIAAAVEGSMVGDLHDP